MCSGCSGLGRRSQPICQVPSNLRPQQLGGFGKIAHSSAPSSVVNGCSPLSFPRRNTEHSFAASEVDGRKSRNATRSIARASQAHPTCCSGPSDMSFVWNPSTVRRCSREEYLAGEVFVGMRTTRLDDPSAQNYLLPCLRSLTSSATVFLKMACEFLPRLTPCL